MERDALASPRPQGGHSSGPGEQKTGSSSWRPGRVLLDRISRGDIDTGYLGTHHLPLDEGSRGYDLFKHKEDGCLRVVFRPSA